MIEVLLINGVFLAQGTSDQLLDIGEQLMNVRGLPGTTRLQIISLAEYRKMKN